jgi:predicted dehydrogenase
MIKWGIIGCGDVTEMKSGPAFNKVKNSTLVAVMRRDELKAKDYAMRHNVPRWYNKADQLIDDPEVNAVYVATPPGSHAEYAIQAMRAGKAVYVEKPMATSYEECLEMIRVSEETRMPLFVAYYRRGLPGFRKVKEIIRSGLIGDPVHFSIRFFAPPHPDDYKKPLPWRVIPEISGGGYIFDLGCHQLDVIDFILGPIKKVSSLAYNRRKLYEPEDFISAGFICESGATGDGLWDFAAPGHMKEDKMIIYGEKGRVEFSCFGFTPVKLVAGNKSNYYKYGKPQHVQLNFIRTMVNELTGEGKCPGDATSAARTNLILDLLTAEKK